ncbi:unnamed protein product [Adineta ricciae]|uniref:Transglutaminase-like domain-containing protein n=1 Tax=Adineta ricciae TaxID=249248 RepID=A0A813ZR64_ADIRI|nr:unnamed protein product [Adineta ricciae]CAF0903171.1 unnamed protein product [Adineta ricciae]
MGCKPSKVSLSKPDCYCRSPPYNRANGSIDLSPADVQAFSPRVCQQRQSAIDNMRYREAINRWRPSSLRELASYVEKLAPPNNQIECAWIIFYWISQNISYDTTAYFQNRIASQTAEKIFQNKRAVCEGYSVIYADLCEKIGIRCRKITGYTKGFGFDARQTRFRESDHAWNIITLNNGHSYLIESTWGSGHLIYGTNRFTAKLAPHYFMCPPEHLIYSHLPERDSDQLLEYPLTMNQFLALPHVYSTFFTSNLQLISPVFSNTIDLIRKQSYGEVIIRTSNRNIELSGALKDEKHAKVAGGEFLFADKNDPTLWKCQFAPPKPGKYDIEIYANTTPEQSQAYSIVVKFVFDVARLRCPTISFPYTWPTFFQYNLEIIKPKNTHFIDRSSSAGNDYSEILIRSPKNVDISASMKNSLTETTVHSAVLINYNYKMNLWQCLFAPPAINTPFDIIIFAKYANEDKFNCAAKLKLFPVTKRDRKQSMMVPKVYHAFTKHKAQLIEPLNGTLRKGSTVRFRCRIPGAQQLNITVDNSWTSENGITSDAKGVFDTTIRVRQQHVGIWVKMNARTNSYEGLLQYTVK